jgi:hypothetical protein
MYASYMCICLYGGMLSSFKCILWFELLIFQANSKSLWPFWTQCWVPVHASQMSAWDGQVYPWVWHNNEFEINDVWLVVVDHWIFLHVLWYALAGCKEEELDILVEEVKTILNSAWHGHEFTAVDGVLWLVLLSELWMGMVSPDHGKLLLYIVSEQWRGSLMWVKSQEIVFLILDCNIYGTHELYPYCFWAYVHSDMLVYLC